MSGDKLKEAVKPTKIRKCIWCEKDKKLTEYINKYNHICKECKTITFKKGKFIISFK